MHQYHEDKNLSEFATLKNAQKHDIANRLSDRDEWLQRRGELAGSTTNQRSKPFGANQNNTVNRALTEIHETAVNFLKVNFY